MIRAWRASPALRRETRRDLALLLVWQLVLAVHIVGQHRFGWP